MITLREYQREGLNAIWEYYASGKKGNACIAWPTGVGKSICPAEFIQKTMLHYPNQRFLMITHVKELIEQNAEVMRLIWPEAPLGIYSAGLKSKQFNLPIVYGGIQSMIKCPQMFGHRDMIWIDEAHLVSQDDSSMYQKFISSMKAINPLIKIVGMSATPFRMGQGMLTDNGLFTDIVHDLTKLDAFNKLIADGYMCPLIPKPTKTELDISGIGIANGDYIGSQLQAAVDKKDVTIAGLKEVIECGQDRKSWLIFSSGIEHAEHIAEILNELGIECAPVHSKRNSEFNDRAIRKFKNNELRAIVNYSKLTTGFNHPNIDLIADFRPTLSIPLHIQKLGRGTRPAERKKNCLVLDFGRNVQRLGCINDPIIPKKKGNKEGELPVKICENCGTYNHLRVRYCDNCGHEFQFQVKITAKAGSSEIIKNNGAPVVEVFEVDRVMYLKRQKEGKPPYIQVTYFCRENSFNEFVFPEHNGYAKQKFKSWWQQRHDIECPQTVIEAMKYIHELRTPKTIRVWLNRKYPEILQSEF